MNTTTADSLDDGEGDQLEKPFDAYKLVGILVGVTFVLATVAIAICCVFCWKKKPRGANVTRPDVKKDTELAASPQKAQMAEGAAYVVPPPASNGMIVVGNAGQGPTIMVPSIMPQPGQHPPGQPMGSRPGQPMGPRPGQPTGPRSGQPMGPRPGQPTGPRSGQPMGPRPGQPTGPRSGQPMGPRPGQPTGPRSGQPMGPRAGQPMGPRAGQPMDPRPGQPIGPRPTQQMGPRAGNHTGPRPGQPMGPRPGHHTGPRPGQPTGPRPGQPGVQQPGTQTSPPRGMAPVQQGVSHPQGYYTSPRPTGPNAAYASLQPTGPTSVQPTATQQQGARTLPQQNTKKYPNLERKHSMKDNRYIKFEVPPPQDSEKQTAAPQTAVDSQLEEMAKMISRAIARTLAAISIDAERISRKDVLGSGQYGVVYKGELANVDKSRSAHVALKTIAGDASDEKIMQEFMEEVLRMKTFSHPNVMPMLGMTIIEDKPYMVLPFMEHGDLRTYISNPKRTFTVEDLLRFVLQVAKGMDYLSQQNIIHGDLAARNCMVDQEGSVKVADFGLSRHLFHSNYYSFGGSEQARPVRWMATECLTDQRYTVKSDVWAYGVLMYEVMTRGHRPYSDIKDNFEVIQKVTEGHRMSCPEYTAPELYEIMAHCWSEDAANRPSFKDLSDTVMLLMEQAGGEYEMPVKSKS